MATDLTTMEPKVMVTAGRRALFELTRLIHDRPDKVMIHGKQYLEFPDWELLGVFFGVTPRVIDTQEITIDEPSTDGKVIFKKVVGFKARAVAIREDHEISAADAECMFTEENWREKPRFQLRSMAQTRACSKALRNCLSWIVRLPESDLTDTSDEEEKPKERLATYQERLAIVNAAQKLGIGKDLVFSHIKVCYGKAGTAELTPTEAKAVLEAVQAAKLKSDQDLW